MGGYFLDTNLFVLLVVGNESRDLIPKHGRLEHYSVEDYDILSELLEDADQLFVTPNTLTETRNLVSQHGEPERSLLMKRLQYLIHESKEIVVTSTEASSNAKFEKLGLTDAALLETVTKDTPLLTVDRWWSSLGPGPGWRPGCRRTSSRRSGRSGASRSGRPA